MTSKQWDKYMNKEVILVIEDLPYPRQREGLCIDIDETHIWLQTEFRKAPIPFSRSSVKRVDIKKEENKEYGRER